MVHVLLAEAVPIGELRIRDDVQATTHHRESHPFPPYPFPVHQLLHSRLAVEGEMAESASLTFEHPQNTSQVIANRRERIRPGRRTPPRVLDNDGLSGLLRSRPWRLRGGRRR